MRNRLRRYSHGLDGANSFSTSTSTAASAHLLHEPRTASPTWSAPAGPLGSYDYDPYGGLLSSTGTTNALVSGNPLRFDAQLLETSGRYHLGAREMSPSLGRVNSRHPVSPSPWAGRVSPYIYADDWPTVLDDRSGTCSSCVAGPSVERSGPAVRLP